MAKRGGLCREEMKENMKRRSESKAIQKMKKIEEAKKKLFGW